MNLATWVRPWVRAVGPGQEQRRRHKAVATSAPIPGQPIVLGLKEQTGKLSAKRIADSIHATREFSSPSLRLGCW